MIVNTPDPNNLILYHGPISLNLTSFVGNYMKTIIDADPKVISRIFKVFVELVQNVSNYSAKVNDKLQDKHEKNNGIGWFTIDEFDKVYKISTGNLIQKEHGPILLQNCDEINKLDEVELRNLKRETRKQASVRDIGAHIGLIHTGLITNNPLEIDVSPVNDTHSFFRITAQVNKEINN